MGWLEDRNEKMAERMFNAYNEESPNPWKTYDGKEVPRWPALGPQVQAKWRAAARVALKEIDRVVGEQMQREEEDHAVNK